MIYDVSVPIDSGMPVWPSDPAVSLTTTTIPSIDRRRTIRVTSIQMGSHTGTHIDAPNHFVEGGKKLNQIPIKWLVGQVSVFHIAGVPSIKRRHLEQLDWVGVKRVLFKTDNSDHWKDEQFYENYVYMEPDAAVFLVERGLRLVGIDYLFHRPLRIGAPSRASGAASQRRRGSGRTQPQ
jgi:arylformamidase